MVVLVFGRKDVVVSEERALRITAASAFRASEQGWLVERTCAKGGSCGTEGDTAWPAVEGRPGKGIGFFVVVFPLFDRFCVKRHLSIFIRTLR
jgi:hypothetical protein